MVHFTNIVKHNVALYLPRRYRTIERSCGGLDAALALALRSTTSEMTRRTQKRPTYSQAFVSAFTKHGMNSRCVAKTRAQRSIPGPAAGQDDIGGVGVEVGPEAAAYDAPVPVRQGAREVAAERLTDFPPSVGLPEGKVPHGCLPCGLWGAKMERVSEVL